MHERNEGPGQPGLSRFRVHRGQAVGNGCGGAADVATVRRMARARWLGGYVHIDREGRRTFVVEREVCGRRYHISTRCHTERAALAELSRFERDPAGYRPGGASEGAVFLDADLSAAFLLAHLGNSGPWQARQHRLIAFWTERLAGVDLRRATLRDHILPALPAKGRAMRIAVVKRLYSWLRETDKISAAEDPCLGKLKMPQARPAQVERSKVIPLADFLAVRAVLVGPYRDAIDLLAGTGWHVTEAQRFAVEGRIDERDGATVLEVRHKSGSYHRTIVSPEVAGAATRLRAHGGLSLSRLHKALLSACRVAKVPPFRPGWFRHTVATLATEQGAGPLVSGFLGHRSATTTRRFYSVRAVPPKVPTLR